jgi:hypothetical protein
MEYKSDRIGAKSVGTGVQPAGIFKGIVSRDFGGLQMILIDRA